MSRNKILSLITIICYALTIFLGVIFGSIFAGVLGSGNLDGAGIGGAVVALLLAVILVFGYVYAAIGVLPLIFKIVQFFTGKRIFAALSIPFDLIYILLCVELILNSGGDISVIALLGALLVPPLLAFVTNIMSFKK